MKIKPANLVITLLFGLGSMTFASYSVLAEDSKNSTVSAGSAKCTGELISTCGLKVIKTTCIGSTVSSATKSGEADDESHLSKDKDSSPKNDRDYNEDSHEEHEDRSAESLGNKVSICHRMGGSESTLLVTNDGWLSGHSKHTLDTIGRCADFDAEQADSSRRDSDSKISASSAGYSIGLTPSQISCLKGSPGSSYTINGIAYPGGGLNNSNFTINLPSPSQGPSRGGVRTLH